MEPQVVMQRPNAPKLSVSLALFVSVFTTVYYGEQTARSEPEWWTTHALVKVLPSETPPSPPTQLLSLAAARNEFEPFQIILHSPDQDLRVLDAVPGDLRGPNGSTVSRQNVRIYLERYITLKHTSTGKATNAEWPDPLVPRIDQYLGERRNSFPFTLHKGRNQPLWVEIYIPPTTPPGNYDGKIDISLEDDATTTVPFRIRVWGFTLPSTASYKTSFGLGGASALKQHRGAYTSDHDLEVITTLYAKAMLWHRISFHGGTFHPPKIEFRGDRLEIDWSRYDREMAPFLNGTVFAAEEPLSGAKLTSIDLRADNRADTPAKKVEYWRQWVRHFVEKGWIDRLFFYVQDEPTQKDLPKVRSLANIARQADPRLRTLVTTSFDETLADSIDIWTPLINCTQPKPGFADYCERTVPIDEYRRITSQGKELWWYQSCSSHGCKAGEDNYFRGWPNYLVDGSAVANRIMPWISWKYGVSGELHYNVVEAPDPWEDIYLFGGNGEGTLFYPGRPDRIGGTKDVPVESIRLKLIREGIEDYEYMAMLRSHGWTRWADQQVGAMVRSAYDWQQDPAKLYEVRNLLGETLERLAAQESD